MEITRRVHYKQGYKITINNKFYELSDGKTILFFGELKHKPTIQEVWNKTMGLRQEEIPEKRKIIKKIQSSSSGLCNVGKMEA